MLLIKTGCRERVVPCDLISLIKGLIKVLLVTLINVDIVQCSHAPLIPKQRGSYKHVHINYFVSFQIYRLITAVFLCILGSYSLLVYFPNVNMVFTRFYTVYYIYLILTLVKKISLMGQAHLQSKVIWAH